MAESRIWIFGGCFFKKIKIKFFCVIFFVIFFVVAVLMLLYNGLNQTNSEGSMNKKILLLFVVSVIFLSGCANTLRTVSWPSRQSGTEWYKPQYVYSQEEAVSILKSLAGGGKIYGRGISFADADQFTFRANIRWQEVHSQTDYVPSYSGFFVGWNYIPVYGGSYQTTTNTLNKEENVSLDFRSISDILIEDRVLYVSSSKNLAIDCGTKAAAQKYADAFYSMLRANGQKLPPSAGWYFGDLSEEQIADIGFKGALVLGVHNGGPAQKAGLEIGDIIYEAAGKSVENAKALARIISETRNPELKVINWKKDADYPGKIHWEKRLIKIKPVER